MMPPTRGHDLKLQHVGQWPFEAAMPPTRGHDLKPINGIIGGINGMDAPHTGARLETFPYATTTPLSLMPPTRGHDLKHGRRQRKARWHEMPPTRGHDLKRSRQ